ncbi:hypothetical protein NEMIN01_2435 [Nematocida minor]|uniref:uncharacterized protein n=1 Tax=Nematocida minor TaxID=1912983 RepID=UPI002220B29C|nr:uncharacterized protein NEMIN01_2435 [Nematocida minor]KAI5193241.1 hypothetical protein NEMIN01_2435 [Nematocida minor]
MIPRVLKKVIAGVLGLVCLQRASCNSTVNEASNLEDHFYKKMLCMEEEVQIRTNFMDRLENFKCEEISSDILSKDIAEGRINLSKLEEKLEIFNISAKDIVARAENITKIYNNSFSETSVYHQEKTALLHKTNDLYNKILNALPSTLRESDSLSEAIKEFDSHMLGVIKKYDEAKNKDRKLHELNIFKLAEQNKPLAARLIYLLFDVKPLTNLYDTADVLYRAFSNMERCLFLDNFWRYVHPIIENKLKGKEIGAEIDLLKLLDKNLSSLFSTSRIDPEQDADIMRIYLNLVNGDIPKEKINQYKNITPRQVMKVLIIECEFNIDGLLIDYRRNSLLSNIGKIIMNKGNPAKYRTDVHRGLKIARSRQKDLLNLLQIFWNGRVNAFISNPPEENVKYFCIYNDIITYYFQNTQDIFMSVRWMYSLNISIPPLEESTNNEKRFNMMCFDMSYIHPMRYIYMRCEYVNDLCKPNIKSDKKPFSERDLESNLLRIYKIRKENSDSTRADHMKSCIRAWFIRNTSVTYGEEKHQEYDNMTEDFQYYLNKF